MKIAYKSEVGKVRKKNEDHYLLDKSNGIFIVADGVGGHQRGEVASHMATAIIHKYLKDKNPALHKVDLSEDIVTQHVIMAINKAHEEILKKASKVSEYTSMGTTVVLAVCRYNALLVAHVGDSRAYLINKKQIRPLTRDHSLVERLVSSGLITPGEAINHNLRHVITQCLGCEEYQGPDVNLYAWRKGDVLLLCSDGLTDMVEDRVIHKTVIKKIKKLDEAADKLVKLANKAGGKDNITFVLVSNEYA